MARNRIALTSFFQRAKLGYSLLAATLFAITLAFNGPVNANPGMSGAEKLYRLNAMLLATGQYCRSTPNNFTADFASFTDSHVVELTQMEVEFRTELAVRYGNARANRVLSQMNRSMANSYAKGHPWLDCAQLKLATRNLTEIIGRATLEEAAHQLIIDNRASQFADARH